MRASRIVFSRFFCFFLFFLSFFLSACVVCLFFPTFRLSPVIPYNLLNLAAAATSVGLLPFALASAVGIVPECALLVYAGELL